MLLVEESQPVRGTLDRHVFHDTVFFYSAGWIRPPMIESTSQFAVLRQAMLLRHSRQAGSELSL
jgi:hypothetical protein